MNAGLSALIEMGVMLGVTEVQKLLDRTFLSTAEASSIANRILNEAAKKGNAMLNKASIAITNIPQLAGSPSIQAYLSKVRRKQQDNYQKVEDAVADLNNAASNDATKVQDLANKSIISKAKDAIFGNSTKRQAQEILSNATNRLANVETKIQ